jgi:predicted negative regulator of RcsB-dependent stress response
MYIKHRNQENQENLSKAFFAFHKNPQKEIPTALKNAEKNIYLDLAYLESANILRNKKEYSAALEKLYELLQKTKYIEIRNLAKIHAAFIIIDNKMIDESQKILKIGTVSSEEPFSEILNWSLAQLYIMNNDPEAAKNTLKTVNPKSNATQIMNEILENSIITK